MRFVMTATVLVAALLSTSGCGQQPQQDQNQGQEQSQNQDQSQGQGQRRPDIMARVDTNSDGKVSLDEYKAFAETRWSRISDGADSISVADADERVQRALAAITPDASGKVTHAAYIAAQPAAFKKLDTNGDSSLDRAELTAGMGRGRGGGGQGGGGQGGGGQGGGGEGGQPGGDQGQ